MAPRCCPLPLSQPPSLPNQLHITFVGKGLISERDTEKWELKWQQKSRGRKEICFRPDKIILCPSFIKAG